MYVLATKSSIGNLPWRCSAADQYRSSALTGKGICSAKREKLSSKLHKEEVADVEHEKCLQFSVRNVLSGRVQQLYLSPVPGQQLLAEARFHCSPGTFPSSRRKLVCCEFLLIFFSYILFLPLNSISLLFSFSRRMASSHCLSPRVRVKSAQHVICKSASSS